MGTQIGISPARNLHLLIALDRQKALEAFRDLICAVPTSSVRCENRKYGRGDGSFMRSKNGRDDKLSIDL